MGEVKEAVKGTPPPPAPSKAAAVSNNMNVLDRVRALCDEVSDLTAKKDADTLSEGAAAAPDNQRKAATLRAVHSLLTSAKNLLKDY